MVVDRDQPIAAKDQTKVCRECQRKGKPWIEHPLTSFKLETTSPDGYGDVCRTCRRQAETVRRRNRNAVRRQLLLEGPEIRPATLDGQKPHASYNRQYAHFWRVQEGRCRVCGNPEPICDASGRPLPLTLYVNNRTRVVVGLLCSVHTEVVQKLGGDIVMALRVATFLVEGDQPPPYGTTVGELTLPSVARLESLCEDDRRG